MPDKNQIRISTIPGPLRRRIENIALKSKTPFEAVLVNLAETALTMPDPGVTPTGNHLDWAALNKNDLVSPEEASSRMRMSVSKLAKLRCRGEGPKYLKLGARTVRYRVKDVENYLNTKLVQSTSETIQLS